MSKVALLCPGPSIRETWSDAKFPEYDLVVAVNTAGWFYKCHWLAFADKGVGTPIFEGERPKPISGVLVASTAHIVRANRCGIGTRALRCETRPGVHEPSLRGCHTCGFTMPNALKFALDACEKWDDRNVDIYGMDWSQTNGVAVLASDDHSLKRWRREATWLRYFWQPRIQVFGRCSRGLLWYVAKRVGDYPAEFCDMNIDPRIPRS
jgi:hypothetical protein